MDRRTNPGRGSAFDHMRHAVTTALRDVVVSGLVCLSMGAVVTEVVAYVLTGVVPSTPTHIAAGVIGLMCGYAAAVTALLAAVLRSLGASMEWVIGEVERVAGGAIHEAESVLHVRQPEREVEPRATVAAPTRGGAGGSEGMASGLIGGIVADAPRRS